MRLRTSYGTLLADITSPYDAEWVEALKGFVPHTNRSWDDDTKTWTVNVDRVGWPNLKHFLVYMSAKRAWATTVDDGSGVLKVHHPNGYVETVEQGSLFE